MSATEFLKALARVGATRSAVLVALSLSLAGCNEVQPTTKTRPSSPPQQADTRVTPEAPAASKPPEAPATPTRSQPQTAQRSRQMAPPPATANKGAERLLFSSRPLPVRAREQATPALDSTAPKAPIVESSGAVTGAPAEALVIQGPPPAPARLPLRAGVKALACFGLVFGGGVLAIVVRLCVLRRLKPAPLLDAGQDQLRMPRELGFKESINAPREQVLAEKH